MFDIVGLLNLLNMLDFYICRNMVNFIYNHYHNNILWLDRPYKIIERRGVNHDYLIGRRSPVKAIMVQQLMGAKTNRKYFKLKSIILPHVWVAKLVISI